MDNIPNELKNTILKWSNNIFNNTYMEYIIGQGYENYLRSNESLHQIWGAAALHWVTVAKAEKKSREVTPEEIETIKNAFISAANSRRKDADRVAQTNEEERATQTNKKKERVSDDLTNESENPLQTLEQREAEELQLLADNVPILIKITRKWRKKHDE